MMILDELAKVRTNNFNDPEMGVKIQQVWEKATRQLTGDTVLYGVYHQFASDYRGDYTLSIAAANPSTNQPLTIDIGGNRRTFTVDPTQEMAVYKTWQTIWSMEKEGRLSRAYQADYEKYNPDGSIEIVIELKD